MDRIFVHKIVLKVIGQSIKNYMYKRVCGIGFFVILIFFYVENSTSANESIGNYNPWPDFHYTGKLRPYPIVKDDEIMKFSVKDMFCLDRSSISSTKYSTT
jgi:hypothetical protein